MNAARQLSVPLAPQVLFVLRSLINPFETPKVTRLSRSSVVMVDAISASIVAVFGSMVIENGFELVETLPSETVITIPVYSPCTGVLPVISPFELSDAQLGALVREKARESDSASEDEMEQL